MSKKEAFSIPGIDPALELAAQSSNDFFYVVFENGEILFANSPASDLIGKAPKKLSDVFDEDAGFRGQFLFEKATPSYCSLQNENKFRLLFFNSFTSF